MGLAMDLDLDLGLVWVLVSFLCASSLALDFGKTEKEWERMGEDVRGEEDNVQGEGEEREEKVSWTTTIDKCAICTVLLLQITQ